MSRHILVVTDTISAGWVEDARLCSPETRWSILALGIGSGRYSRENGQALATLGHAVINAEKYVAPAQKDLQTFYPDFVYNFPRHVSLDGQTLLDLLRRESGVNLWWLGEACEKGPLRGAFTQQLYSLGLLHHVLKETQFDEIWLWLTDEELKVCAAQGLASAGYRVRSLVVPTRRRRRLDWFLKSRGLPLLGRLLAFRLLVVTHASLTKLTLRALRILPPTQTPSPLVGLYSRFPILWRHPYTLTQQERYFAHLESRLKERAPLVYFVWISDWPQQLWQHRRQLGTVFARQGIIPLVLFLTFREILGTLFDLDLPFRYLRYHFRMASSIRASFLEWNIANLWDVEIRRTLTGSEIQQNLLIAAAIKRLTSRLRIRMLINPLEFQPMERAIWAGAEGQAPTVAVQHSTFSKNHFMYFFKRGELAEYIYRTTSDPSPMPDYFIVAGVWPFEVMLQNGVPQDVLGLCGPIRYNDLIVEQSGSGLPAPEGDRTGRSKNISVLVLTSISLPESVELIESLAHAALALRDRFTFLFKCHYHCRVENKIERLFAPLRSILDYRILDVHGPLHEYIRATAAVLVGATTAALEAWALGSFPIIYNTPTLLNLSPLDDLGGEAISVSTPEQLAAALTQIHGGTMKSEALHKRMRTLEQLFYRLDGRADERFVEFLESKRLL